MSTLGFPYGLPGQDAALTTVENAFLVGDVARYQLIPVNIQAAAVDAGASPTYELRSGLILGRIGTGNDQGQYKQYDPAATDGSQQAAGILYRPRRMQDYFGNTKQRMGQLVLGGYVRAANLFGLDEKARRDLFPRFWFDDFIPGTPLDWKGPVSKAADYTVLVGDNGTHFTAITGAVNFTLPAIGVGRRYRFTNEVAATMTVTAPANKLVTFNNLTATSVAFSTGGNQIGASVEVVSNADGTKYLVLPHGANTMTVA